LSPSKSFVKKNGLEVFYVDPRRFSRGCFQIEKQFIWEKIIANTLCHCVIFKVCNDFVSLHISSISVQAMQLRLPMDGGAGIAGCDLEQKDFGSVEERPTCRPD
jgi:hypothetical protein